MSLFNLHLQVLAQVVPLCHGRTQDFLTSSGKSLLLQELIVQALELWTDMLPFSLPQCSCQVAIQQHILFSVISFLSLQLSPAFMKPLHPNNSKEQCTYAMDQWEFQFSFCLLCVLES